MEKQLCKLTLVYPSGIEELIVELLLAADPPLKGFTTWSVGEQVRGRVKRSVMVLVMPRMRLSSLLETIRTRAAVPHLAYWVEPVECFGRLT
jgi:hypothetical protein